MRAFSTFCWRIRALDRKMKASSMHGFGFTFRKQDSSGFHFFHLTAHLGTVLKRLSNSSKRADSSILCSFRLPGWISFHDRQKPRMPKPFTPSKVNIAVVPWPGKAKDTCHHHQQPFPGRVFPVACRNHPYFLLL